ncbi:hypothetical protein LY13_003221 [Prauserella aidingensis]|uniref:hypothetical protein n=1 Tax=Prauserella aidingensis TaxID=387890 RepID=UPI0020A2F31B|nr:hypothetical protein [Prauserella aidingensis]MCP2254452.1 hypothetical protein [Prauserella aidingensis]
MSITVPAGLGGIGFVLTALVVNVLYLRGGLPLPGSGGREEAAARFAAAGSALRRPSVLAPASWLLLTVFAAGLLSTLRHGDAGAWALVGFAGVLMQNVTFTVVEALRFGIASAAAHDRASTAGLWSLTTVLFGFNQLFLATALVGFTVAGTELGVVAEWHAVLGHVSAGLLFLSASAAPYTADGPGRLGPLGLVGWLGWLAWIVACSVGLLAR